MGSIEAALGDVGATASVAKYANDSLIPLRLFRIVCPELSATPKLSSS